MPDSAAASKREVTKQATTCQRVQGTKDAASSTGDMIKWQTFAPPSIEYNAHLHILYLLS